VGEGNLQWSGNKAGRPNPIGVFIKKDKNTKGYGSDLEGNANVFGTVKKNPRSQSSSDLSERPQNKNKEGDSSRPRNVGVNQKVTEKDKEKRQDGKKKPELCQAARGFGLVIEKNGKKKKK